jgi:nucleoside-diphosphate-sugar epimerase
VRVFLTGASGFIGRALAARLRADGHEVGGVDLAADAAAEVVAGDIARPGPWQDAAAGAEVVVHAAAYVGGRMSRPEEIWAVNTLGTRHVVDAAARAGAARLVHISSVTVFGVAFPDGVDETHPPRSFGLPYADAKIASEQVVLQAHAEGLVPVCVVRPGDVYGPGSGQWSVQPVDLIRRRRFVLPPGTFSPVYVDDLIDGIVRAASTPAAAGQVVTLSGGVGVPNATFFAPYAAAIGRRLVVLPWPVVRTSAALAGLVPGDDPVNPAAAAYMHRQGTYAIGKADRLLGWRPRTALADGQDRALAWLRERGLV